ncbi:Zn-dependent hydrolase [Komagataeibacter rhaeticus]|uniref:M20 family metallo-hydrolase n=1 Tax=Komagataeibacter rhaeticus TaxID=215221 RepID=UPI0004D4F590|nr:M20 family metallo-hydrolase [Komagataeibacter rhaeticus]KDU97406.1 allantoate amidohydrolase [Komagataeibacter rhaeticus AF1]MBL7238953.1 M20 family metallo-hydrolase [Komagataeibacter rhaeticus]PYD54228.1 Zn-dependent hydrolase [Komagataeibacter rhaeticus]GBQ15087.1 N-carbamyl-L-amino acid amidohydrolase [Komagataeibacter rhaeticus DSM 16663]
MTQQNTAPHGSNIGIDGQALWADLMETARFGGTPKGGVRRLTLTAEDRQVRDWFARTCEALGCTVTFDSMGNQFARRPGLDNSLPPITIGSHLDTQPTGGKYDGILGVLGGLSVLRALERSGYVTRHPIEVINWTNEEGSRFTPPMMCSGVFTGVFTEQEVLDKRDRAGKRFGDELEAIGYRGSEPCGQHPVTAYFELHIEQGPILEAEGKTIGIVTGVQGARWYEVTVKGKDAHAGSTPMPMRHDALLASARMIEAVSQVACAHAPTAVGTVGLIENRPNSNNVVPGEVFFTIDMRDPDDAVVRQMEEELYSQLPEIARRSNVEMEIVRIWDAPAVHFDPKCIGMVEAAATESGYGARRIVSGPGHDAAYMARVTPTTMIFVPCADGLSHNEAESITEQDAAAGAGVLLKAILKADAAFNAG